MGLGVSLRYDAASHIFLCAFLRSFIKPAVNRSILLPGLRMLYIITVFLAGIYDLIDLFIRILFHHMTMTSPEDIKRRIIELEVEHRDLDAVIDTLISDARHEELQLRRLKKRKLQLKDHITLLKMQLVPDVPA